MARRQELDVETEQPDECAVWRTHLAGPATIMILAEAAPAIPTWAAFAGVAAFMLTQGASLAAILSYLKKQETRREIYPQPLTVQQAEQFASKRELEKHIETNQREHENLHSKIGGAVRGVQGDMTNAVNLLRGELTAMGKSVARLETETKNQNAWLKSIDEKLDERTVPKPRGSGI